MQDNMDVDSDKSLQEELLGLTAEQVGLSESDDDPPHKVCYVLSVCKRGAINTVDMRLQTTKLK
jgi:hypothetical protein